MASEEKAGLPQGRCQQSDLAPVALPQGKAEPSARGCGALGMNPEGRRRKRTAAAVQQWGERKEKREKRPC